MVQNHLAKTQAAAKQSQVVKFEVNGATVELTPKIVRDYLVSGDKEKVTMQELVMFINLCKFNGLNPWLREAYCIKYGNEPATIVTGKEAFEKRAELNPNHNGHQAGVITVNEEGVIEYQIGSFHKPDTEIIGGWAEVWRKDHDKSTRVEVSFDEYAGRKRDGSLNGQWSKKPGTMIRKVALVQALREAFPNIFSGMMDVSEVGMDDNVIDEIPNVDPPVVDAATGEVVEEAKPQPAQEQKAAANPAPAADPVGNFFANA